MSLDARDRSILQKGWYVDGKKQTHMIAHHTN